MSFKSQNGTTLGIVYGDRGYANMWLFDKKLVGKGNGIHVSFSTQAERETFVAAAEAYVDGTIKYCKSEHGSFTDESKVRTNDTYGDSATRAYKVKFSDTTDTCTIIAQQVLNTKVTDLGTLLKGQTFMAEDGVTALTVLSVNVETAI